MVCGGIFQETECGTCANNKCCDLSEACAKDSVCDACITDPTGAACANNANYNALLSCVSTSCFNECTTTLCNPVTNAECKGTAGSACDVAPDSGFVCYEGPFNTGVCGGTCGTDNFCQGGLTCVDSQCAKICCADADCGANGTCLKALDRPDVGVCVQKADNSKVQCTGLAANPSGSCVAVDDLTPGGSCSTLSSSADACDTCAETKCCGAFEVCLQHQACTACLGGDEASCFGDPFAKFQACLQTSCTLECTPTP